MEQLGTYKDIILKIILDTLAYFKSDSFNLMSFIIDHYLIGLVIVMILFISYITLKEIGILTYLLSSVKRLKTYTLNHVVSIYHLKTHSNILINGFLSFIVFFIAIIPIALTPISYIIPKDIKTLDDITLILSNGNRVVDWTKVETNYFETLVRAFSSGYFTLLVISLVIFYYITIKHLVDERVDTHDDDSNHLYNTKC